MPTQGRGEQVVVVVHAGVEVVQGVEVEQCVEDTDGDRAVGLVELVDLVGEVRLELTAHREAHLVEARSGRLVALVQHGPYDGPEGRVHLEAGRHESFDAHVERAFADVLEVEDGSDLFDGAIDGRTEQIGAAVEVPVDRAMRHTGAIRDLLGGRIERPLAGEFDDRVEHGVDVARPTRGPAVHRLRGGPAPDRSCCHSGCHPDTVSSHHAPPLDGAPRLLSGVTNDSA